MEIETVPIRIKERSDDELLAHELLLCAEALKVMAANPGVYPPHVVNNRGNQAYEALKQTKAGMALWQRCAEEGKR